MQSARTERSRLVELSPVVSYNAAALPINGPAKALIRSRSRIFGFSVTAVPDGTSAVQCGVAMSMDGVIWMQCVRTAAITDLSSVPVVIYSKADLTLPQVQRESDQGAATGNEYELGMKFVRLFVHVLSYVGPGSFDISAHMIV